MAKDVVRDVYANLAYGTVTESAANTLTFAEIQTNVNIFDKVAWILSRIEWYVPVATYNLMTADSDLIQAALCASKTISALGLDDPAVIDLLEIQQDFSGTPATAQYLANPIIRSFSELPGGGRIIAPRPLYLGLKMTGAASAATVSARLHFRQLALEASEYVELIDFYRIIS